MKIKGFTSGLMLVFSAGILLLASACTVDYTVSAMEKARTFALKNTRDLTEYQRNHIRYVYPAVWKKVIFDHKAMTLTEYDHMSRNRDFKPRKNSRLSYGDLSFAWENIPGLDYTVIVLGNGEMSGNFWEPLKMVYKKNAPIDGGYEKAKSTAVDFVINNMLTLSAGERNRVRFSEAQVAQTSFDLSYASEEEPVRKKRSSALEGYLASLKEEAAGKKGGEPGIAGPDTQYSLVWQGDDPEKLIVISGIARGGDLGKWKILSGALLPVKVFEKYLAASLYFSPADRSRGKLIPGGKDATVRVYRKRPAPKSAKEKK